MALLRIVSSILIFLSFLLALSPLGCGPKKPHFHGPGHDADWPIESPNAEIYATYAKAQRLSFYGKIDEAIDADKEALKLDPTSSQIPEALAFEYTRKGDLVHAEQMARRALSVKPNSRNAYFLIGKIQAAQQHWAEGETAYKKAIALDPENQEESVVSLASLYVDSKQYDAATQLLNGYVEKNPNSMFGYYYLGRVYSELNKPDDALKAYEKSLGINPGFAAALKATALIYEGQGKKVEAKKAFEQVLELQPDNLGIRNHLSQLYLDDKDYGKALEELEVVVEEQPENLTARLRLGLLYLQKNELDRSEKTFKNLLKDAPQKDRVYYYLGVVEQKKGDIPSALKNLEEVESSSDVYVEARLAASYIYEDKGDGDGAIQTLRTALKKISDSTQVLAALCNALAKHGKEQEAISLLETELKKDKSKRDETLWFALGEVYDKLKNLPKLEESLRKVLEINSDNASALNYLGYTYADRGIKLEEAEKMLKRALEIKPKDGYITDSLGWLYFKKHQMTESLKFLEEANQLSPNESVIMEHLADVLLETKDKTNKTKAKDIYEKALKISKEDAERQRLRDKLKKIVP